MVAQSNFNTKSYELAGYYFDRFTKDYPKSSKKEESSYLSAYSYMLASPVFSLDPTATYKALNSFQSFIDTYPDSKDWRMQINITKKSGINYKKNHLK